MVFFNLDVHHDENKNHDILHNKETSQEKESSLHQNSPNSQPSFWLFTYKYFSIDSMVSVVDVVSASSLLFSILTLSKFSNTIQQLFTSIFKERRCTLLYYEQLDSSSSSQASESISNKENAPHLAGSRGQLL